MHTRTSLSRRAVLTGLAALPLVGCTSGPEASPKPSGSGRPPASSSPPADPRTERAFRDLERKFDARLGVHTLDTGSGRTVTHRPDERFAYASTCKALLVGAVLDKNSLRQMDRLVRYGRDDLVSASPVTERHVATGMTLRELSDAAIRYSDNTAANLLFHELGSPAPSRTPSARSVTTSPGATATRPRSATPPPATSGTPAHPAPSPPGCARTSSATPSPRTSGPY